MVQIIAFVLLSIFCMITLVRVCLLAVNCIMPLWRKKPNVMPWIRLKRAAACLAAAVTLTLGLILLTQLTAYTPRIVGENSIAELKVLELNGRRQWISLRGQDRNNPVLLFLAGGPGGSQMAAVRHELSELEQHFVVVNWDQPGSGKSYFAQKTQDITVQTYIEDGHALTEYLKERFSKEEIYLVGESWGSALGIFLSAECPQNYHAVIGVAQMVDFAQTERMDYAKAMEIAQAKGDAKTIERLEANGIPPYYGKDVTWKSAVYLNYLSGYMASDPEIHNPGYNTIRDIGSSEYGLLDKINYVRGVINTFNYVYPQLYHTDLRVDCAKLNVPVYFFLGRHDLNAPTVLVEDYLQALDAPDKKIVWFEHSGHSPWINERAKFVKEVYACFLQSDMSQQDAN